MLSLSIAAADGDALSVQAPSEHTPGSGVAQSLGAANSMFTATTNTTPILPSSVGTSSVGKHHRRLGSMGKTKRRLSDAREASVRPMYVFLSFPFLAFSLFVVLLHISLRSVPVPVFPCSGLSLLAPSPVIIASRMSCVLLLFFMFLFARCCLYFAPTMFGF